MSDAIICFDLFRAFYWNETFIKQILSYCIYVVTSTNEINYLGCY